MEEIEVGEYVRDCDGFIVKVNEIQEYKEDDDFWYQEKTLKGTWKSMMIKHSKNIIDLIEVGDYVNGKLVVDKLQTPCRIGKQGKKFIFTKNMNIGEGYFEEDIKTIVTKEQFASMEYKVGE